MMCAMFHAILLIQSASNFGYLYTVKPPNNETLKSDIVWFLS